MAKIITLPSGKTADLLYINAESIAYFKSNPAGDGTMIFFNAFGVGGLSGVEVDVTPDEVATAIAS